MTTAERITAIWNRVRPKFEDAFHPDYYAIERMDRQPDGTGGYVDIPVVVESGRCSLAPANRANTEGMSGPGVVSVTGYEIEMPIETAVTASDTLMVNGRRFEVIAVRKGGDHELFATVLAEERG